MAKSKPKLVTPVNPLIGRTLAFVGKFGYGDSDRARYAVLAEAIGAKVVDAATTVPDVLAVGEGRGGKPPGDVAKIQKKSPGVDIYDVADFVQFLIPTSEQMLEVIRKGRQEHDHHYWQELNGLCRKAGTEIDLQGVDLRKGDLYGFELEPVQLSRADLRGANCEYTHFGHLEDVKFDECVGKKVYLRNLHRCSFRKANLTEAWMFWGWDRAADTVDDCDFTGAQMNGARVEKGKLTDCRFGGATLCDAEFEHSTFTKADFSKADLSRVHASGTIFRECRFEKANLQRADLRGADLRGADLRGANLREAVLNDADLTNADVTGADFENAVLTGAKLKGVNVAQAKNYSPPKVRQAGPKLQEFAQSAAGAKSFETSVEVDLGPHEFAKLELHLGGNRVGAVSRYVREGNDTFDRLPATTFEEGLLNLADRWPKATLRLDSVQAKGSKTLRGQKLLDLAIAAWAETFGVPVLSPEEMQTSREEQQAAAVRERDELMERIRREGVQVWDDLDYHIRDRYDLRGVDLSGAKLDEGKFWSRDLRGANFAGASCIKTELWNTQLQSADFTGANLRTCEMSHAVFSGAKFSGADLTECDLKNAKLQGVDLSQAILTGAQLEEAQFDESTVFPAGFKPPARMVWKGNGMRPDAVVLPAAQAGSLDFETFLKQLGEKVEAARMQKAGSMLKAERFELFADVQDASIVGIVKSQSSKDLVYSCRLTSDGSFGCCTQNLKPCGGLRGALCKHLLVLIVGLAKAGKFDAATVDHWINLSRGQKPGIDVDSMSATFLRYKGAEAGEIDWRPTETIPEDFYAM